MAATALEQLSKLSGRHLVDGQYAEGQGNESVDVIVPAEAELQIKVGQRVKGGESVLAAMPAAELAAGVSANARTVRAAGPGSAEGGR